MSMVKKYGLDPYTYIKVDLDREEVTEAAYRCPGKPFEISERKEDSFEKILYKALAALSLRSARELKKYAKNDEKLKEAFVMLYKRKQRVADIYRIKDDE